MDENKVPEVAETKPEVSSNNVEGSKKECKNKKTALKISIITAIVAVVAVGGFFAYKLLLGGKNPVKATSSAIRGLKESIADVKDDNSEIVKILEGDDAYEIESTIKLNLGQGSDTYTVNLLAQMDEKNEKAKFDISALAGKYSKIMDLSGLIDSQKVYFKFNDTMDKFYFTKLEEAVESFDASQLSSLPDYDYENIIDYLADAFESALSEKDFKKSKDELTIKDKDVKVNKYTATIDENKLKNIADAFIDKVLADKDLLKVFAQLSDTDTDELVEGLKEFKKMKASELGEVEFEYSVYSTSMGKVVGYGFSFEQFNFVIASHNDVTSIQVLVQGMPITFDFEKKNDNHIVATGNIMGMISGELDIVKSLKTISKNKEYKEDIDITFTMSAMGQSNKMEANISSTIKKIDSVDTSAKVGAVDIDTLSDADAERFMSQVERSSTYKFFESLAGNLESSNLLEV